MKITGQQIEAIGLALVDLATGFDLKSVESIKGLLDAGTELNDVIAEIKEQTDDTAQEVWNKVSENASDSIDAYNESAARHS